MFDSGDLFNWQFPFYIYDQGQTYGGYTPTHLRLGYWKFDGSLVSQEGQAPFNSPSVTYSNDWSGKALSVTETQAPEYYIESGSWQNLNWSNGTVRFWYQPNWYSTNTALPGFISLFTADGTDGNWGMFVYDSTHLVFNSGRSPFQSGNPGTPGFFELPINFQSNYWYQIALTYSPSNIALYTNGILAATAYTPIESNAVPFYDFGSGLDVFPTAPNESDGFCIGADNNGGITDPCLGQIDEFETFNYPLSFKEIGYGFPGFGGPPGTVGYDADYDGRSDMLETNVDRTSMTSASSVAQCRLGYWRFDTPDLIGEQGQIPLSSTNATLVPSWSGMALNISSAANSHLTYSDVSSNGWANINCRQGSLRFWFKPNSSAITGGTFLALGNTNPGSGNTQWSLNLSSGSQLTLATATNGGSNICLTSSALPFSNNQWMQIAVNYGPFGSSLYTNGTLAASSSDPISLWPPPSDRARGIIIGNNAFLTNPINGQMDELETFNYQLAASDISNSFQQVEFADNDLDGVPDILEDLVLSSNRPFFGPATTIAGTVEAEQFDLGGLGVAYSNAVTHPASSYRPTGMMITNCDDILGATNVTTFGYCLQMLSNEWTKYSINVLMPQTYTIETRVAPVGAGTGGVFEVEFANASGFYTNTGPLTNISSVWTNVAQVVYLPAGLVTMKLHALTNSPSTNFVGRFNYISVYPWWQAGFTSTYTYPLDAPPLIQNSNSWYAATNNTIAIQNAISSVISHGGGTVLITNGTYYVSQVSPNETANVYYNAVAYIYSNDVALAGSGTTNTTLVAYNRATTMVLLGSKDTNPINAYQCTNVTIRDLTIEGQPHLTMTNATTTAWTNGDLLPSPGCNTGTLIWNWSPGPNSYNYNILVSNCQFTFGDYFIGGNLMSNVMIRNCDFTVWGGANVYSNQNQVWGPNTTNYNGSVSIFCGGYNLEVLDCVYNGNTNISYSSFGSSGSTNLGPDGFVWFQGQSPSSGAGTGNNFVARNYITNNHFEGIQLDSGPTAVVGNVDCSAYNNVGCTALCARGAGLLTLDGTNEAGNSTCYVGNWVVGGRNGEEGSTQPGGSLYRLIYSGNCATLYPPTLAWSENPGGMIAEREIGYGNFAGNTLLSGGHGLYYSDFSRSVLVLDNDFRGAAYKSIGWAYYWMPSDTINNALIFGNLLGEGVSSHVQVQCSNTFGWFLNKNTYYSGTNIVQPFIDPLSSSIHLNP